MKGNLRTLLRKFCLDGSVLGLKYFYLFPDKFSRCFWLVWISLILYLAMLLTYLLHRRFEAMPTRITIENQFEPVATLPYPAITICSPNQLTMSAVKHLDETLVNGNRSFDLTSTLRQLLGFYHFLDLDYDELVQLQKVIELNRYTVPEVMTLLPQSCDRFLRVCSFRRQTYYRCRGLFHPVLTKHGLCCVFNNPYQFKTNRRNERDQHFKPYLVEQSTGFTESLIVITDYEPDDAVDYSVQYAGATRIMFNDWTEFPADDESLLLAPATESFHLIHATATYCSSDVKDLPADSRKCLFEDERSLPFFRAYHNSDCDLLCLVHAVEDRCHCLMFYLPHLRTLQTCEVSSILCIVKTKLELSSWQEEHQCECPRDCDSRRYRVDSTIGNIDALRYMFVRHIGVLNINQSSSIMHFFFPTTVYEKQKQETVMSLTTLASNLGGVFGLCLGVSVIGVLEMFFYQYSVIRNCARASLRTSWRRAQPQPRAAAWGYYE